MSQVEGLQSKAFGAFLWKQTINIKSEKFQMASLKSQGDTVVQAVGKTINFRVFAKD